MIRSVIKNFIFILLFSLSILELEAITFRGRIFSRAKDKGEPSLTIMVFETKKFYSTDANGYFTAEVPSVGTYTFKILRSSGTQEFKKAVNGENDSVVIYTDKRIASKGGIDVSGEKDKTVVSRYKVRIDEINRMPGTFGEALKGLETLPGVIPQTGFGIGQNGVYIRGADSQWNTILYDDLPLYYMFHYDTLTSVVHNGLLKTIDIYSGAYPANFNNATGGVIEIEAIDKVKEGGSGTINVSLWHTDVMYKTPMLNGKGYVAAAARVGYLDKTLGNPSLGIIPEGIQLPHFTDSQIKAGYNFSDAHQITFINLFSEDAFSAKIPTKYHNDPTQDQTAAFAGAYFAAGQGFRTTALRYTWSPGSKFSNRLTLINYRPWLDLNGSLGTIEGNGRASYGYTGIRQDANWRIIKYVKMEFGSEYRKLNYFTEGKRPQVKDPNNPSPNPYDNVDPDFETVPMDDKITGDYYNAYTSMNFNIGNFEFVPGIRYDYNDFNKQSAWGPRAAVSYKIEKILGKSTTFFGGYGEMSRYPMDVSFEKTSGNPDLEFEKAKKYSIGIDEQFNDTYQIKTEVFKNEFSNLIVQDPYISDPVGLNPNKNQWLNDPVVYNRPRNYSNRGDGWSRGFELLIKKTNKPLSRDWFGWVSYTWSQSFRNTNIYQTYEGDNTKYSPDEKRLLANYYNNSKEQFAEFDRTHVVNVVFGWRLKAWLQIGGRWSYLTSPPYRPVTGSDGGFTVTSTGQPIWSPTYSNNPSSGEYGYSKRTIPYNRLDIRIDFFKNYDWGYGNWYIELVNVYLRQNKSSESYDVTQPYSKTNPSPSSANFYDSGLVYDKYRFPFFNIGMEVKF